MFIVFADQVSTTNIYTHEFNISCMHAAERRENLSNGHFAKCIPSKYTHYTLQEGIAL